jgi:iron complex transport system substrate-binding protein
MQVNAKAAAFFAGLFFLVSTSACAQDIATRTFTDAAGREVVVPAKIDRVFAAGPPAAILVYTLAPDKLLGWSREVRPAEREYMPEKYADLPVLGRLTGKGNTANIETVVAARPDIILDVGDVDPTYVSLAERTQEQTGIPYVLLDGSFPKTPETYRLLGTLLGEEARGAELAGYAEQTMADLDERLAQIPAGDRPRVYYGRGPEGLETGLGGSINVEILERIGATNVAAAAGTGGLTNVSPEQILGWDPDAVLLSDPKFYRAVSGDPRWQGLRAVREGRVYLAPGLPFGWFDAPPGVNRLIGVRWLTSVLYPDKFPEDLRSITRDFYSRFYHVDLSDPQLDKLLQPATAGPS